MKKLFLASSVNTVANSLVSEINPEKNPKLIFINTASEPEEGDKSWLEKDRQTLVDGGFEVTDYTITDKTEEQIKETISPMDVIFVSGGNTFYLLEKAQQSNFIPLLRDFVFNQGKIYIGSSAGSVFAGPDIEPVYELDDVTKSPNIKGYEGARLVDFVVLPHWGSDKFKKRYLNKRVENNFNTKNKLILLTDNQYVKAEDDWYRVIDITD